MSVGLGVGRLALAITLLSAAAVWPVACATGADEPSLGASVSRSEGGIDAPPTLDEAADAPGPGAPDSTGAPVEPDAATGAGDADAQPVPDAVGDASSPGDAPAGCTGVQILCGSTCVDPTTDPDHCGGCSTVCSSGLCGATLAADMSAQPANWTFNGAAVWDPAGPSARMTQAKTENVAGTVVYDHPIVTDGFDASFQFRIGANGGGQYDGMGFMLEVNGPTALGSVGGGLGMAGLNGLGVELDIYNNGNCGDSNANHVGIDQLTACGGQPTSLFASPDLTGTITLSDAQWHTATVHLAGSSMSIAMDGHAVATSVQLTGFTAGTSYYYGFAGAIGGGGSSLGMQTEVKSVTVTFPSPRCL
jgi:hypothetical protein